MICTYCNESAYVRCRKHRQYLCGCNYCTQLHRWGLGDCEFVQAERSFDWTKLVLGIGIASVVVAGAAILWVHL